MPHIPLSKLSLVLIALVADAKASTLTISGTPAASVVAGTPYEFLPRVENANFDQLQFYYLNKPSWSKTYRSSGLIRGTPAAPGVYSDIQIGATDGEQYALTPPFTITVTAGGIACLTWVRPQFNLDGSPLTDLEGYVVRYGTDAAALDRHIAVSSPSATSATIENLAAGTWFFDVAAENAESVLSPYSPVIRGEVP